MELKYAEVEDVVDMLSMELGRPPTRDEAMAELGAGSRDPVIDQAIQNWKPHHPEFMPGGVSQKSRPIYYFGA